jgi:hypothetical protein
MRLIYYTLRWLIAITIVSPLGSVIFVLIAQLYSRDSAKNISFISSMEIVAGFYGGYIILVATVVSIYHTTCIEKRPTLSYLSSTIVGARMGFWGFLPLGLLFALAAPSHLDVSYIFVNLIVGAVSGGLYGLLVTKLPPHRRLTC